LKINALQDAPACAEKQGANPGSNRVLIRRQGSQNIFHHRERLDLR
jgi:hypothetical protein